MKKIYILCFSLLMLSCDIQYEGDNRLMIRGKVIDKEGNPISNLEVITNVSNGNGWGSRSEDIGIDITDIQGSFTMFFPKPKGEIAYSVQFRDYDELYQDKRFVNIFFEDFSNLEYNLQEVKLYKKEDIVNLQLNFSTENFSKEIRDLNLIGEASNDMVWVNPLDDDNYYTQYFYQVIKNQTITIEYNVYDYSNHQTTIHTETIYIADEDLSYIITY